MRAWALLLLLGATALSGCLEPYRVHVDGDALAQAPGWSEFREKGKGSGLGAHSRETRYTFDPSSANPPFPGTLQVFAVRSLSRLSQDDLLQLASEAVDDGATSHAIRFDGEPVEGKRTLASGVRTQWLQRTGTTTQGGPVFDEQVRIRILAEVGHDGKSDTSFLAVAIVQVERAQQCPIIGCAPVRNESTWIQVVGDPEGSIGGATSTSGFIENLVTH